MPAVADFIVYAYPSGELTEIELSCPTCHTVINPANYGATIRDLIDAASQHARTAHGRADRYGYACQGVSETGY